VLAVLAVGACVIAACAGWLAWRARRESRELRDRLESTSRELEHLQTSFARFVPADVVERIIATGISTQGEHKQVTVLFTDLVASSSLAERLEPEAFVAVLNGFFRRMSRAAARHRGHVSKFIGDGMLVLFGAIEPNPWQANDAARAALAMREALSAYNEELANDGIGPLRAGIGIHQGSALAGLIGSDQLMEFTVLGGTVNLAARVENLTRRNGTDILVTAAVRDKLDPRFLLRELPAVKVRGIAEPVVTYALEQFEG